MKKFLMTIAAVFAAMNMSAQVYVGGSIGVASVNDAHNESETVYKFVPEIGYNLNDDWAVGVELGYQKGACTLGKGVFGQDTDTEVFSIAPYARYTVVKSKLINLFVDGGIGIGSYKDIDSFVAGKLADYDKTEKRFYDLFSFMFLESRYSLCTVCTCTLHRFTAPACTKDSWIDL